MKKSNWNGKKFRFDFHQKSFIFHKFFIHSKYVCMMSFILIVVPIISPAIPMNAIITFLNIKMNRDRPDVKCHRVQQSKNAGIVKPNMDKVNAPNSDMKRSKFGMATANKTTKTMVNQHSTLKKTVKIFSHLQVMHTMPVRKEYSHSIRFERSVNLLTKYCVHARSIATCVTTAFEINTPQLIIVLTAWANLQMNSKLCNPCRLNNWMGYKLVIDCGMLCSFYYIHSATPLTGWNSVCHFTWYSIAVLKCVCVCRCRCIL